MRQIKADLHVHTCLSPCGDAKMRAAAIVKQARKAHLDMIGICDHNSAENVEAVLKVGAREGLPVIPGIEITSQEEVHILGLFPTPSDAMNLQELIYENLDGENDEQFFGSQLIIDEQDHVQGTNTKLLIGATCLTVEQIVDAIHQGGGLAIASHIDRQRFGIIGQLGFIPEGLRLDAVEVSNPSAIVQVHGYPVITSSDAHYLEDVGKRYTSFFMEEPSLEEMGKALRQEAGRKTTIH
jgi:predicted metal-dependent phosphoesterase TrpH